MQRVLMLSLTLVASGWALADDYATWKAGQVPANPSRSYIAATNGLVEVHVQTDPWWIGEGRFTIGTADGRYLMYGHNDPSTSWVKFQVDGTTQSPTLVSPPALVGDGIVTVWAAGGVQFTQTLTPTVIGGMGTVRIEYDALNQDAAPHEVGVLLQMDTQINWNDWAPISTSHGYAAVETCFDGADVPLTWQAFEQSPNQDPSLLVGCGILAGSGATLPDRFAVGRWPSFYYADFGYSCESVGYGDSAVLLWWTGDVLPVGGGAHYQTYYGTCTQITVPGELSLSLGGTSSLSCDPNGLIVPDPFDVNLLVTNTGGEVCHDVWASITGTNGFGANLTLPLGDLDPGEVAPAGFFVDVLEQFCGGYGVVILEVTSADCASNTISREIYIPCCQQVGTDEQPVALALGAAHPNPFNPATTIAFTMAEAGPATLTVHNLAGAPVATLWQGLAERGVHQVEFNAGHLPSGVYFYTLGTEQGTLTRKMVLAK